VIPARRSNYGRRRHAAFLKSTSVALLNAAAATPSGATTPSRSAI